MKKNLPKSFSQSGQVVLVVLLVMAVVLTVGLSIASRSVTDVKISQQSQEAARALWVAQAGLEKAVKANIQSDLPGSFDNNSVTYNVVRLGLGGGEDYLYPQKVSAGEPATVWLVGHNENTREIDTSVFFKGKLTIYWGNPGESATSETTPALEATLIYKNGGNYYQKRYVYDPNVSRRSENGFSDDFGGGQGLEFSSEVINLNSIQEPYLLRIKMLYSTTPQALAVKADGSLPKQGNCYESSAKVVESGVTRKLKQCQLWEVSPAIFDYVLFSGGNL